MKKIYFFNKKVRFNNLFIITRYGVGQKKNFFYKNSLDLLNNNFLYSLSKQNNQNFVLILVVDKNIPNIILRKIQNQITENKLNYFILRHNPFLNFSLKPNYTQILNKIGVKKNQRVTTIRVDADDALSRNFVNEITKQINKYKKNFRKIHIDPNIGYYRWSKHNYVQKVLKKGYSIQVLSDIFGKGFNHVYDFSHKNVGRQVLSFQKSNSIDLKDEKLPLWFRTIHTNQVTFNKRTELILKSKFIFNIYLILKKIFNIGNLKFLINSNNPFFFHTKFIFKDDLKSSSKLRIPKYYENVFLNQESILKAKEQLLGILKKKVLLRKKKEILKIKLFFYSF